MLKTRNSLFSTMAYAIVDEFYIRTNAYLRTEIFDPNLVRALWRCKNKHDFLDIQKNHASKVLFQHLSCLNVMQSFHLLRIPSGRL